VREGTEVPLPQISAHSLNHSIMLGYAIYHLIMNPRESGPFGANNVPPTYTSLLGGHYWAIMVVMSLRFRCNPLQSATTALSFRQLTSSTQYI